MRRGERRHEPLASDHELTDTPSDALALEPEPLGREQLARCLDALPERERSVLVMTYFRELRAAEVANDLALSEGNVRVIRHRAIERLRTCMSLEDSL
jgi:RNA polymerase sigma-70 factor (ECF subfamily)